jgi:hypothetical protein
MSPRTRELGFLIPAAIVGLLAHIVVSRLTPPSRRTFEQIAGEMGQDRQAIEGPPVATPTPDVP